MKQNNANLRQPSNRFLNVTLDALTAFGQALLIATLATWQGWETLVRWFGCLRSGLLKISATPLSTQDLNRPAPLVRQTSGEGQG